MAICPFAETKLLPENAAQPRITPRVIILHSAAGRGSLYNFFKNSSSLESHFWVSEKGVIEQYIDTSVRADANYKANGFAISIETESSPSATEPWSQAQAQAIIKLIDWLCKTHNIPRVKCPEWDGAGIGWHIQFGSPGYWTNVSKACPGAARIAQTQSTIIPAVAALGKPQIKHKWISFKPGDTNKRIYDRGGLDNEVTEIQLILTNLAKKWKDKSLNPGAVDGAYGPKSQAAIRSFKTRIIAMQKAKGLKPWPNTDPNVGVKTIDMLRFWNKA